MLQIFTMPDDSSQLPHWIEQQLLGGDLSALVAQLAAVHHESSPSKQSLEAVLDTKHDAVLNGGLNQLDVSQITQFLTEPRLLLQLQEMVVREGGVYWTQLAEKSADLQTPVATGRSRLSRYLVMTPDAPTSSPPPVQLNPQPTRRALIASLAVAATLLIAVLGYRVATSPARSSAEVAWGWSRPNVLPSSGSRADYFNALADSANQWFDKRPTTAAELASRVGQLRQGCSILLLAPHSPLSKEDRDWLIERCQLWAGDFDAQLKAVEAGADPQTVRGETDATVNKLIDMLRDRASG